MALPKGLLCVSLPSARKNFPAPTVRFDSIVGNLSKAGWSWGYVSAVDSAGRTIFVADAHRDDGKRFIVRAKFADELSV